MVLPLVGVLFLLLVVAGAGLFWQIRRRHMDRWLAGYIAQAPRRRVPRPAEDVHVLLCIADHWEPKYARAAPSTALSRVQRWVEDYPRLFGSFHDSDGRTPRHTFFYPAEEYEPEYLDALAELCAAGFGEVELHLHHHNDTPDHFRATLARFKETLAVRHGLLGRHRDTGAVGYVFIHGNWTLCNSRPDGRFCGVDNELDILRETGCYADMTLPSAPDPTQTAKINSIYYAVDQPGRPRSHETGVDAGRGPIPERSLLLVQGPLVLDWTRRKWGLFPRLENGCLQASQPPSLARLPLWLRARVQVPARPDWFFVKLHAHGAVEDAHPILLGAPMVEFHRDLAEYAGHNPNFHYHYVTAREMVNLVKAAEGGWTGSVQDALDHVYVFGLASHRARLGPGPACIPATSPLERT